MTHEIDAHLTRLFDKSLDYVCVAGLDGYFKLVNPAFSALGYSNEELLAKPFITFIHPDDQARIHNEIAKLTAGEASVGFEFRCQRKDGSWKWLSWNCTPPIEGLIYIIARDVSEHIRQREQLMRLAHYDALTGLVNLSAFYYEATRAIANAQRTNTPLALLFIDLDGFKCVNDTLGHHAGNQVLQDVATHLRSSVRKGDAVARLGGDEFAVLLSGEPFDPEAVATRILESLSTPYAVAGHRFPISSSIGIALTDKAENINADELLRLADREMYNAKRAGGNRYSLFTIE